MPGILVIIYLCPLQCTAVVDINSFPFSEEIVHGPASLSMAVAGLLHPAERQMGFGPNSGNIHIGNAGFDITNSNKCFINVPEYRLMKKGRTPYY